MAFIVSVKAVEILKRSDLFCRVKKRIIAKNAIEQ